MVQGGNRGQLTYPVMAQGTLRWMRQICGGRRQLCHVKPAALEAVAGMIQHHKVLLVGSTKGLDNGRVTAGYALE
jgi:hypothetical protein